MAGFLNLDLERVIFVLPNPGFATIGRGLNHAEWSGNMRGSERRGCVMEWWQVLAVIGGVWLSAAMLRRLWVVALLTRESIAPIPELDGYVPNHRRLRSADPDVRSSKRGPRDGVDRADTVVGDDDEGIWIELDVEPLFKSSDRAPVEIVDSNDENEPEARA